MKLKYTGLLLVDMGIYYGYPMCCIGAFIDRMMDFKDNGYSKTAPRKFHGTGYIPCAVCNNKSEDELLATIARNRRCRKPFPHASDRIPKFKKGA